MLHISNGDSAGGSLREAGLGGEVLAWRDVLHEGPVPAGLPLGELSAVRAEFIEAQGWAPRGAAADDFTRRDAVLSGFRRQDEVCLWFEHDLYDQLQLLQILDWLAGEDATGTALSMVCIGAFPGVERFYGLGQLTPAQLASLYPQREPITREQLDLARAAWAAFRAPDPTAIGHLLAGETGALPYLREALLRHLAELPAPVSGVSRIERSILDSIAAGQATPGAVFTAAQEREAAPFWGDVPFWSRVRVLASGPHPLVDIRDDGTQIAAPQALPPHGRDGTITLDLSEDGRAVRAGEADHIHLNGVERWLGGVHLTGHEVPWRWDENRQAVVSAAA